jgi:hypothetical protein
MRIHTGITTPIIKRYGFWTVGYYRQREVMSRVQRPRASMVRLLFSPTVHIMHHA